MCTVCIDLGVDNCPPALAVREPDFDAHLALEDAVHAIVQANPVTPLTLDATTWLVLHSRLHRAPPATAGVR